MVSSISVNLCDIIIMYVLQMFNCGNSEVVVGKQTIITHSLQHSVIVKTNLHLLQNPKDGIFNVS